MDSAFATILRDAVEATPRAVGSSFAARDGEMVDWFSSREPEDWAFLTAHYGILLSHLDSAFGTWHFGGPDLVVIEHERLDVLMQPVREGYFALIAVEQPAPLAQAATALAEAVRRLHKEMG